MSVSPLELPESSGIAGDEGEAIYYGEGEEYELVFEQVELEDCLECGAPHAYPLCWPCAEDRWDFVAATLSRQVDTYLAFLEEVAA